MAEHKRIDEPTGTHTVGHEWDGIEELDTPMPRWWLLTFLACIVFAIGYTVVYPAWPGLHGATKGLWAWNSRAALKDELAAVKQSRAATLTAIAATPIEQLPTNKALFDVAVRGGEAAFKVHCVQCHGSGADGIRMGSGYPNLNDDDWLWGGDLKSLEYTITSGVRNPDIATTRTSLMPAFGKDGILTAAQVQDAVSFVRTVSRQDKPSRSSQRGAALFAANCAVCHGPDAKGNRTFGAPNLTDGIWLYGGSREAITQTVTNSRHGVMPAWGKHLDATTIKMLAAYVHSRGGGESNPVAEPIAASNGAE